MRAPLRLRRSRSHCQSPPTFCGGAHSQESRARGSPVRLPHGRHSRSSHCL
ncbi:Hypothetical protein AA314_01158 [Archangium gephyra]|uniref:Uncharacterized protein n=1 Tax=Archangium gephyra TaxID=48 RepID=A0AAC8TB75_9BACT|nr:Hypothetical protein AA314_01158 [Archangium gephyra]